MFLNTGLIMETETPNQLIGVIAHETGQPLERVKVDIERDFWMGTDEAIEYGLVSRVVAKQADIG